jgi:hypothetical protein
MGASEEGADTTGVENKTWASDVLLVLLDLPYDGMPSTMVTLRTPSNASRHQQRTSMEAATDYVLAQPSKIREVANPGVMATGVVHPLATMTGSVRDGQLASPTGRGDGATTVNHNVTIPQESGGQMDMEMTGAASGIGHDQVLPGLDGGEHRIPATSLVGNGVDGEDQTGPPTTSTETEVNMLDGKKGPEISPAWKGPIQPLMVTPKIS